MLFLFWRKCSQFLVAEFYFFVEFIGHFLDFFNWHPHSDPHYHYLSLLQTLLIIVDRIDIEQFEAVGQFLCVYSIKKVYFLHKFSDIYGTLDDEYLRRELFGLLGSDGVFG